jgi:LytS/YehU family sensor histidine kinase
MPPMEISPDIPMELSSKMPLPKGFRPDSNILQSSNNTLLLNNFLVSILIIVASSSLKLFTRWISEDKRIKDIEQQKLKNELMMLRNQVSPHFLMNTLNNIYALVDINSNMAKDAIIRLSTLMRYMLYDTGKGHTTLDKEIEFIKSYFSLMKLRFSNNIDIKINIPEEIPDIQIAPMIIITFLENAFKHGVSYNEKSYISFDLEIKDGLMHFSISNSIHKKVKDDKYSGIGLENVKKSLELLYQDNYCLKIKDDKKEFMVDLTLPALNERINSNNLKFN